MDTMRTARRIVLVALAVCALALPLLPLTASDAAAAPSRGDARDEANDFILWCVSAGGAPEVHRADDGGITVSCYGLPGGGSYTCSWFEGDWSRFCNASGPPRPVNDLPVFEVDPDSPLAGPDDLGHDLTPAADNPKDRDHGEKRHGKHKGGKGGRR